MSSALQKLRKKKAQLALKAAEVVYPPWIIENYLFKEQLNFVKDPSRYALACCSVRSGKSTACAADLIDTALRMPGTLSLYITLARSSGERIVWPELMKINRDFGLGGVVNLAKLSMVFPNGSTIYLLGANDDNQVEMIRGLSNVALVYIDEAQSMRELIRGLIDDIIAKRLYDTNGRCRVIGTPGPVLSGYFYDSCEGTLKGAWSQHKWTMFANPHLFKKSGKTPQQLTDEDCSRRGVTIEHPSIQRENYGVWAYDPEALLLSYTKELNDYETLPTTNSKYTYILGIDLGQRDYNFICVLAFTDGSPVTWLVEEHFKQNQRTDDLAQDIKNLIAKYNVAKLVVDAGGLGLALVEDMKARHGLPLEAADKTGKMSNYALLNNALRTGNFKAKYGSVFQQDCNILQRDDDKSTPDRINIKGHSDAIDAALYAFKFSPAYAFTPPPAKIDPKSPEYAQQQAKLLFEGTVERLQREKEIKEGKGLNWQTDDQGVPPWLKWE